MDLHFEAYGQGEAIVILHGLFGSLENWRSIGKKLASNFRVYALDHRNHGQSPHSFEMDYFLMAEDVREFIQKQSIRDAVVLGHSMGGKTAMQLALVHAEVVKKLVVVDIAPRGYPRVHDKVLAGMLALDLSHFQNRMEIEAALAPATGERATRNFLLKNVERSPSGRFRWKIGLREIQRNQARLAEGVITGESFDKPTLFIRGENSDYLLESDQVLIRRLFPRVTFLTISGAGHLAHVEKPDEFVGAIFDFLRA